MREHMLVVFAPSLLCMESNALEESIIVFLEIFCIYFFNNSTNSQNMWNCGWLLEKSIFPKNFSTSDWTQNINLSNYSSKNYASVVFSDFKVAFLGRDRCSLSSIFLCFVYGQCCIIEQVYHQILLSEILQEVFHQGLQLFCF